MKSIVNSAYEFEKSTLCRFATFSQNTKGRAIPVEECTVRTPFGRDRDRIIHSKSFRRLMYKTQCFLSPEGDHYRTRLTHTLEVSQIARTVAKALHLNEDLVEAASLAHDLGHTPFGHAGERVLNELCPEGFSHNKQSLRVVTLLENDGKGLNLTYEVRDGIVCHTGEREAETPEGRLIRFADKIAYINHDIDDAIRGGVLKNSDLPKDLLEILGDSHGKRIDCMVMSLINQTKKNFENNNPTVEMEPEIYKATMDLRSFLFENIYFNPVAKSEEERACVMLRKLYDFFTSNTDKIPDVFKKNCGECSTERLVCDYLACMTDRFAVQTFENLFIPKMWGKY